jgi:hypothetical protein
VALIVGDREWIGERPLLRCVPVEDLSGELTGMRVLTLMPREEPPDPDQL